MGIEPTFPNTGYGYIESDKNDVSEIKKVRQFREKPNYETAKQFLADGNFLWNAGIFIWSVHSIVASFEKNLTEMNALFSKGKDVLNTSEEKKFIDENYYNCFCVLCLEKGALWIFGFCPNVRSVA